MRSARAVVFMTCVGIALAGCGRKPGRAIRLATTTSMENSGLLDELLPAFEKNHGSRVHVIAVGTGKAIGLAESGDVDAILVHAPEAERDLVEAGFGVNRRRVCHNDFVILGPRGDPAGVGGTKDAAAALTKIAESKGLFVSRGDDSGTHRKERTLWRAAGIEPEGPWYMAAGQGMGPCLVIAREKRAYVMSDRGTYLAFKDRIDLEVLLEGDGRLLNTYSVIAVSPARHPHVKHAEAMELVRWLISAEARKIIAGFELGGERLFHPDARTREGP